MLAENSSDNPLLPATPSSSRNNLQPFRAACPSPSNVSEQARASVKRLSQREMTSYAVPPLRSPRQHPTGPISSSYAAAQQLSPLDALLAQAPSFEQPSSDGRNDRTRRDKENEENWIDFRRSEEQERFAASVGAGWSAPDAKGKARALVNEPDAEWQTEGWDDGQLGLYEDIPAVAARGGGVESSSRGPSAVGTHASQGSSSTLETATSRAGEGWTTEDGDASPVLPSFPVSRSTSAQSQNPSLSAVAGAGGNRGGLERWNSTRRYMAQLDPDDETESLADGGDRATWASDPRDSVVSAQSRPGIVGREGVPKQNTMSSMTLESTGGDPFHYSAYEGLPLPSSEGFRPDSTVALPRRAPYIDTPPSPASYEPSVSVASNPVVRIGPPSPTTEEFLSNSNTQDSQHWRDEVASLPPTSPASPPPNPSPASAAAPAGRVPSQVAPKNFSRPFMAPREPSARNVRSDSVDSLEGRTQQSSLGHGSSLGHSSSIGHSSSVGHSSQGGHSMSSSWEERQQFGWRRQEAEKQRATAAGAAYKSGHMEELREEREYDRAEERPVDRTMDSPAPFAKYAPLPRSPSLQEKIIYPSPRLPPSSPPHPDGPSVTSTYQIPPPLDTVAAGYGPPQRTSTPPLNSPLSNPRAPPPTPPIFSYSQLTRDSPPDERRPHTSDGPEISPRQRNVLRKPRPEQRQAAPTPSAASPSTFSASPPSEQLGPWSRFRSKSKSSGSKTSRGFDDAADHRFSGATATTTYSQDSSTPTITFQPPVRPVGDLNELAQRARELGEQRRRWDQMNLKPSVAKSAQAGFVHAGEANVEPGWLAAQAQAEGELEMLGAPSAMPLPMRRTVSDQGPQRFERKEDDQGTRAPSLYSNYSFYSLPASNPASAQVSPAPSPSLADNSRFAAQQSQPIGGGRGQSMDTLQKAKAGFKTTPQRTPSGKRPEPESPEDYLQLGIEYHESGELQRAAYCFERSARMNGGCGAGMLMYGLTLQHGWGCQHNAPLGFRYLQSAAESVVEDLDRVVAGGRKLSNDERSTKAAQNELVLALHEIGQSFRLGFGVQKDKKMAVAYFTLSADLGDVDAQLDLAFCYANGKGCKKNLKLAAKYYRMAMAQGANSFGLSWVYKDKYAD